MTDKEYRDLKKRIRKHFKWWSYTMGLQFCKLTNYYEREVDKDHPTWGAKTTMWWEYREYDFYWFMPNLLRLDEEDLEDVVIHELCHALASPSMINDNDESTMLMEHTVSGLQKAFRWVRDSTRDGR